MIMWVRNASPYHEVFEEEAIGEDEETFVDI